MNHVTSSAMTTRRRSCTVASARVSARAVTMRWRRATISDSASSRCRTVLPQSARHAAWRIELVKRSAQAKGFEVIPRRWVVERTIAWINRCRRLANGGQGWSRSAPRSCVMAATSLSSWPRSQYHEPCSLRSWASLTGCGQHLYRHDGAPSSSLQIARQNRCVLRR